MGLKNLREKNHSIDFNVVNPSNNTFNRQKNIITIFVNETKCIFEKNLKEKNHSKIDSKNDSKSDSRLHCKSDSRLHCKSDSRLHSKINSRLHSMFHNMPTSSGCESQSDQTKDYKICAYSFSTKTQHNRVGINIDRA